MNALELFINEIIKWQKAFIGARDVACHNLMQVFLKKRTTAQANVAKIIMDIALNIFW